MVNLIKDQNFIMSYFYDKIVIFVYQNMDTVTKKTN